MAGLKSGMLGIPETPATPGMCHCVLPLMQNGTENLHNSL